MRTCNMTMRLLQGGTNVTTQVADILADLHEDHRNMAVMLDLLARETERIGEGDEPDYELMDDIMRYMTIYSDAVHHPKEDILYKAMRTENPDLAAGLERIAPEHSEIALLGKTLRNDIEAVASGAVVRRDRIIADATDYVHRLRKHMAWEEEDLFRRADTLVTDESLMLVDIAHLDISDPVFGPERARSFANLMQNILKIKGLF